MGGRAEMQMISERPPKFHNTILYITLHNIYSLYNTQYSPGMVIKCVFIYLKPPV